jgi:hypothetical protein
MGVAGEQERVSRRSSPRPADIEPTSGEWPNGYCAGLSSPSIAYFKISPEKRSVAVRPSTVN